MAKTWEEIMRDMLYMSPKQATVEINEMLSELGMTWEEFMTTEEYRRVHKLASQGYFLRNRKKKEPVE